MALVIDQIWHVGGLSIEVVLGSLPSSPPSWKGFVLKSNASFSSLVPTKGDKLMTLKVSCTPYSAGKSNL